MDPAAILSLMLSLLPHEPSARLQSVAHAIADATRDREEAIVLTVISYYEDTFGRAGVPFGACSYLCAHGCHDCRSDVQRADVARWSLGLLRHARTHCHTDALEVVLGWYHTGHCRSDSFSTREVETVHTLSTRARHE